MSEDVKGVAPGIQGTFDGRFEFFRYVDGPLRVVCDANGWVIEKNGVVIAQLRGGEMVVAPERDEFILKLWSR